MPLSPGAKRTLEGATVARAKQLKATYRGYLETIRDAFQPALTNRELASAFDLDVEPGRSSRVARYLSDAPRHRHSHPDVATRLLIDQLINGDLLIAATAPTDGAQRDLIICECAEAERLGTDWERVCLAPDRDSDDDDDFDWSGGASTPASAPVSASASRPPRTKGGRRRATTMQGTRRARENFAGRNRVFDANALPPWGVGTLRLGTAGRPPRDEAIGVLKAALGAGARVIDTADTYGLDDGDLHYAESVIAEALDTWSGPSDDVLVVTKVGLRRPLGKWMPHGRPDDLFAAAELSREALKLESLPLLLLHARDKRVPFHEQLQALDAMTSRGVARRVGLSNPTAEELRVASAHVDVAAIEIEVSPFSLSAMRSAGAWAAEHGVLILAHRPLGGHKKAGRCRRDPTLVKLAMALEVSPEELALAWLATLSPQLITLPGPTQLANATSLARAASLTLPDDVVATLDNTFGWKPEDHARVAVKPQPRAVVQVPVAKASTPVTVPDVISDDEAGEVVIVMGMPAIGKTSAVRRYLDEGYLRLNRDELGGSLASVTSKLKDVLAGGARRVVLDNTYGTEKSRAGVIRAAQDANLPVRCVWQQGSLEDAQYNACLRIARKHGRMLSPEEIVTISRDDPNTFPPAAQHRFASHFAPPRLEEGYSSIEPIPFVRRDDPRYVQKGLFLDCDGTLRTTKSGAPSPNDPDDVLILPDRRKVLQGWLDKGYRLFGITNQGGVAHGHVSSETVEACLERTRELLDLPITFAYCPHPVRGGCWCRKPLPGMGVLMIERHRLDRSSLVMVGDMPADAGFAAAIGAEFHWASAFFNDTEGQVQGGPSTGRSRRPNL